jgi:hypothetical protein
MCFKRDIDKNYVVVKRFPSLGIKLGLLFSLRHVSLIRTKYCFKGSPEASLLLYMSQCMRKGGL